MKITFVIATVHDIGGTAGAVVTQANALAAHHDVEIVSVYRKHDGHHFPLDPRVSVRDLVDLRDLGPLAPLQGREPLMLPHRTDPSIDALSDAALEKALPRLDADVLVTVTPSMLAYATQLAPARTAIVHQEHRSSYSRPFSRDVLLDHTRRADVVAMLTEPMAHWLTAELGVDAPEVVVVPNALPPGFRPRSLLTEPVILAAGRLAPEKQWPQLINAFARIAEEVPEWRLRIFGDGPARGESAALARRLRLYDRVELPGPTSDLASEWARASVSALTSQPGEGFPLVIQEAMAAGVPVVAYDMPTGPRDQIDHDVDGLLVAQGSGAGLSAALLRLTTEPDTRARLGAGALAKAATWDSTTITARWLEIYERAVARRGTASRGRTAALLATRADVELAGDQHVAPHGREGVGVTPERARHEILTAAAALAATLTDEWFVVPAPADEQATLVLPMAVRAAFVRALPTAGLPSYVSVHDPEHRGWPSRRGRPDDMIDPLVRARTPRLLLEPWPRAGEAASHLGRACGVAVEFWESDALGNRHSPGGASYTTTVPAHPVTVATRVHDVDVRTLPIMTEPTPYECRFGVDVVYTWVDGNDAAWNDAREARLAATTEPTMRSQAASGRARFVDRGELRYSMRGVHLFAPWVRRIHLVTAGQVPAWLDVDHPMINVVDHRDLLPAEALPTFNSHAIETAIHRIPGLAEHFLYLNDDFFLGGPTAPERWFSPAGATAVFPSSLLIGLPGQDELPYARAAANNRRLLAEAFGVTTVNTLVHAPYAHRVSVLAEIAERFAPEVAATARAPFRSATDVSMLSSLAQHYGLITGTAYVGRTDYAFVDLAEPALRRRFGDLLERERAGFCLGDAHDLGRAPELVDAQVAEFLERYFPIAAPWEK